MSIDGVGGAGNVYSSDNSPNKDDENYNNFQDDMKAFSEALQKLTKAGTAGDKKAFDNDLAEYQKALKKVVKGFQRLFGSRYKDGELTQPSLSDVVSNPILIKDLKLPDQPSDRYEVNLGAEINELSKMHDEFALNLKGTRVNIMNPLQVEGLIVDYKKYAGPDPYNVFNGSFSELGQYSDQIALCNFSHCKNK